MANASSPFLPIARDCDTCLYLGRSGEGGSVLRRRGEIWVVVHRRDGEWTHVYRRDERTERTFHLERIAPGDATADLVPWAVSTFAIDGAEVRAKAA